MMEKTEPDLQYCLRVRGAASRLNLALFCDCWSVWIRRTVFAVAALLLAYKAFPVLRFDFLMKDGLPSATLFSLLVLTILIALILLRGSWFDRATAAAWMDLHNRAGGRYMAARDDAAYTVDVGIRISPMFRKCLPAAGFLLLVALVPQYNPEDHGSAASLNRQIDQVSRRIEQASKVKALSRSVQRKLVQKAEDLRKQAQHKPEVAAEGVYSLEKELERQVLNTATTSSKQMQKADEFLRKAASGQNSESEVRDLLNAVKNAAMMSGGMSGLSPGLQSAMKQALKESGCSSLGQCSSSGGKGISKKTLKKLAKALSKSSGSSLSKMSSAAKGMSPSASNALKKLSSGLPGLSGRSFKRMPFNPKANKSGKGIGSGGVGRGPGAAPLLLGDKSNENGTKFKAIEAQNKNGIEPGIKLGSFRSTPDDLKAETFDGSARTGSGDPVGLGDDAGGALSPARRRAAQQYFKSLSNPAEE